MKYKNYQRNHVILPGREQALETFLSATLDGKRHKWAHGFSSNSEDALTWSCFDVLRNLPHEKMVAALDEIMEDTFGAEHDWENFSFADERNVAIHIGKRYETTGLPTMESTEVDASIETDDKLVFIEAKLYGAASMPGKNYPYDQIIKKMRVGLDVARHADKERTFYFIFLDLAPMDMLRQLKGSGYFEKKGGSARIFWNYQTNASLLQEKLAPLPCKENIAQYMGWYTWACLFKTVLRGVVGR
ncbi:MAG: hypothetical protein LBQ28_03730 [Prevotellaceae bacterium]|jgi:hypothetical protein|nr:hypothetical protein [Prevotellaceae bacterium]